MICAKFHISIQAWRTTRRFFGIPDFKCYAIADGVREILAGRQSKTFAFDSARDPARAQADMFDLFDKGFT